LVIRGRQQKHWILVPGKTSVWPNMVITLTPFGRTQIVERLFIIEHITALLMLGTPP